MSKKHHPGPVPPGNQTHFGPQDTSKPVSPSEEEGDAFSNQDSKRRLGNYHTAGEHPIEQPGGKQGPNKD